MDRDTQMSMSKEEMHFCSVCGQQISSEDNENYGGMCWECWDDRLTEESEGMFGELL